MVENPYPQGGAINYLKMYLYALNNWRFMNLISQLKWIDNY